MSPWSGGPLSLLRVSVLRCGPAAGVCFASDRRRSVAAHGGLRHILDAHLRRPPETVSVTGEERRRPRLATPGRGVGVLGALEPSETLGALGAQQ
jgi:hypothetical protein